MRYMIKSLIDKDELELDDVGKIIGEIERSNLYYRNLWRKNLNELYINPFLLKEEEIKLLEQKFRDIYFIFNYVIEYLKAEFAFFLLIYEKKVTRTDNLNLNTIRRIIKKFDFINKKGLLKLTEKTIEECDNPWPILKQRLVKKSLKNLNLLLKDIEPHLPILKHIHKVKDSNSVQIDLSRFDYLLTDYDPSWKDLQNYVKEKYLENKISQDYVNKEDTLEELLKIMGS